MSRGRVGRSPDSEQVFFVVVIFNLKEDEVNQEV